MSLPAKAWHHKPRLVSALQAVSIWMQHHTLVIKYPCLRISFISQSLFHTVGMFNATISLIIFILFVPLNLLLLTTQIFLKIINSLKSFPLAFLHPQMKFEHFVKSRLSQYSHGGFAGTCSAADSLQDEAQDFRIASNSYCCLDRLGMAMSECITFQPTNK